jgi:hypothetical protein
VVVVDRRCQPLARRNRFRPLERPSEPAQPPDRKLGQEERGDPCHRKHRIRVRSDCRRARGAARSTSELVRRRRTAIGPTPDILFANGRMAGRTGIDRAHDVDGRGASGSCRRRPPVGAPGGGLICRPDFGDYTSHSSVGQARRHRRHICYGAVIIQDLVQALARDGDRLSVSAAQEVFEARAVLLATGSSIAGLRSRPT